MRNDKGRPKAAPANSTPAKVDDTQTLPRRGDLDVLTAAIDHARAAAHAQRTATAEAMAGDPQ